MSDHEENEPFLTGDEAHHDEDLEQDVLGVGIPTSKHFKLAVKGLTIALSALSGLGFIVTLGIFISVQVSPQFYAWSTMSAAIDLGVCVIIAFVSSTLNLFIQIPVVINVATDITLSIVTIVYSARAFRNGWPNMYWCSYRLPPPYDPHGAQPDPSCVRFIIAMRVLLGVAAGIGLIVGLIFLALLLMRIIAISRSKFWKKNELFAPGEYTYQLSFTVKRKAEGSGGACIRGRSGQSRTSVAEAPLIET